MDMTNGMAGGSMLDLAGLLQNSMRRNDGDGLFGGDGFLLLFLLILFCGWGGNGWNRGQAGQLTNDAAVTGAVDAAIQRARADGISDSMIMDAIKGNQTAIQTLATTFNTDIGNVQQALCALNGGIDKLSGQIGLSGQQVINAIQLGNQSILQQLATCCCNIRENLTAGFNEVKINSIEQANTISDRLRTGFTDLHQQIDQQNLVMTAGFQSIKDMFTQNKIDTLQATVNQLQNNANNSAQTAYLQNYINSQLAPIQNTVNTITNKIPGNPVPAYLVNTNTSCGANYAYGNGCGCTGA